MLFVVGLNSIGIYGIATLGTLLLIFYESFAFKDELKVGWWRGLWYATLPYLAYLILATAVYWIWAFFY